MMLESWENFMLLSPDGVDTGMPKDNLKEKEKGEEKEKEEEKEVEKEVEEKVEEKEEEVEEEKEELTELEQLQELTDKKVKDDKKEIQGEISNILGITPEEKEKGKEKEEEEEKKGEEEEVKEEKKEEVKEEKKEEEKEEKEEDEKEVEKEEKEKEDDDPLLKELSRLSTLATGHEAELQVKPEEEKEEKEVEKEVKKEEKVDTISDFLKPVEIKDVNFIEKDTMGDTFDEKDVGVMNKVLNTVVKEVTKKARQTAMQDAFRLLPQLIDVRVKGIVAAQEFWRKNSDLEDLAKKHPGLKNYVELKSDEVQKANPKATIGQVYNTVEKEVRALLGDRLKGSKEETVDSKGKKVIKRIPQKPLTSRRTPVKKVKTQSGSQGEQMGELMSHIHDD